MWKKLWVIVSAVLGCASAQAQIPVTDMLSIQQQIQQVVAWGQQLTAMQSQLTQQQQMYQSMNGSRGMGQLFNDPSLKNTLPTNWQQVYDAIKNGGYAGLTGNAKTIRDSNAIYNCAGRTGSQAGTQSAQSVSTLCQGGLNRAAQDEAFAQDAYAASQSRLDNIQNLMGQINESSDPKAIADLQARIQAEQAMIQNEQTKLQMFKMLADAKHEQMNQQKYETSMKDFQNPSAARDGSLSPVQF
jgi:type IV secretion system protein VirB5